MEQRKPISHISAGLIIAGVLILMSLIFSLTSGTASSPGGGWLSYIIIIVGLIIFINMYAKSLNNYVTFGNLFSYGFKATAMMTLVFVVFVVILALVYPEIKDQAIETARTQMEKQEGSSDSDIERGIELVENYFWVFMIGGVILGFLIVGCIGSLIGAAIPKKQQPNPIDQLDS